MLVQQVGMFMLEVGMLVQQVEMLVWGWDAHAGNFDQNRGRQHGGTSQNVKDSLNMILSSMSIDTKQLFG